jgi:6-pyruvoyltetrahydropterin/6-carboxytetrahydropterin synthase
MNLPMSSPMIFEVTQEFYFEAAHTLERSIETESSRRIHGHTYHAQVTVRGTPDPNTGMVVDLGHFKQMLSELRERLDHRFLDDEPEIGPVTLENLCAFVWRQLAVKIPNLAEVTVERRAAGNRCTLRRSTDES